MTTRQIPVEHEEALRAVVSVALPDWSVEFCTEGKFSGAILCLYHPATHLRGRVRIGLELYDECSAAELADCLKESGVLEHIAKQDTDAVKPDHELPPEDCRRWRHVLDGEEESDDSRDPEGGES